MGWILETFRNNPAIPIFLTLSVGFLIGQLKFKGFSSGTVTSVLIVYPAGSNGGCRERRNRHAMDRSVIIAWRLYVA